MVKPFDPADLLARSKAAGLPAVEALSESEVKVIFSWLSDSLVLLGQSQPLALVGVPVLAAMEPMVLAEIQKLLPVA